MDFISNDTIIAPATPPGEGGVGILRISGPRAEEVLKTTFRSVRPPKGFDSHRLYHGHIVDSQGVAVDEVLVTLMRAPRSYTGENVGEIHCHGGPVIIRRILDTIVDLGIRLARPGEFTFRAFLNGKLDLAQSEAVIDLIRSRSDEARGQALGQMEGRLSRVLGDFRQRLVRILAEVEAWIDFPEDDLDEPDRHRLIDELGSIGDEIRRLLDTYDSGRILREGASVLILGRPNVGKSSLMNLLLGASRAIVTEFPGTTRDVIEESYLLDGVPLRLVDCAGIRDTEDPVEMIGVEKAREKISGADLVLMVLDGHEGVVHDDEVVYEACRRSRFIPVINKSDLGQAVLPSPFRELDLVRVSARTGSGVEELKERIASVFLHHASSESEESVLLSSRRHREALVRVREGCKQAVFSLSSNESPEFAALGLRGALQGLGEITGETTPQEILDQIFARFCIGK